MSSSVCSLLLSRRSQHCFPFLITFQLLLCLSLFCLIMGLKPMLHTPHERIIYTHNHFCQAYSKCVNMGTINLMRRSNWICFLFKSSTCIFCLLEHNYEHVCPERWSRLAFLLSWFDSIRLIPIIPTPYKACIHSYPLTLLQFLPRNVLKT